MADKDNNEGERKQESKEIDKLINFLEDFTKVPEDNRKITNLKLHGHIVWKGKDKSHRRKKQDSTNTNAAASNDTPKENFEFDATDFEFNDKVKNDIAITIKEKLVRSKNLDEEQFQVNRRLPSGSYGYQNTWEQSYGSLGSYIDALSISSTSKDKKGLMTKGGNGKKILQNSSSFAIRFVKNANGEKKQLIFIKLLNMKNALSKSKRKIILDLDELSKSQSLLNSVIIEPDTFDCAVFGNELFVFHPVYFYYLFVPTDILKERIKEKREDIGKSISDPDLLISAANKPSKIRDLYYFVSQDSKIPEKEEIENDLKILKQYGVKQKLFSITEDDKIECTKENASLVLSYISKKLGLRISDRRLLNVEASTEF